MNYGVYLITTTKSTKGLRTVLMVCHCEQTMRILDIRLYADKFLESDLPSKTQ